MSTAPYPSCPQDEGTGECRHTAVNQQCPVTGDGRVVEGNQNEVVITEAGRVEAARRGLVDTGSSPRKDRA